ncbi:recombinase family protein [Pseudomonas sp. GX19020]|uniref:recombinase family protein n=1 Tax=Pseudomonas sp. GX19020 TaxID=2942277 RepID=UPI002018D584|nr:recombinase family protein [Pseudomonas sp. GX19020]MCL4069367.1 recombinase family protein [Pseudomonas sp. GX19020]
MIYREVGVARGKPPLSKGETDPSGQLLAAEYVRMSTEHQQYSTRNQAQTIREYAGRRDIRIVKTYSDDAKSGLTIGGRMALQQMIADVESGAAEFSVILVYDVTRWGRFQDTDESAYYEYRCRKAGMQVAYCAEQFENDGSPTSTIVKSLKRAMAGEYSRELSVKVFAGQCRLIELGYRQGGPAGFGLRRALLNERGEVKTELKRGEHKSLQTDRVILVPGPDEEVRTVRRIYSQFLKNGLSETEIATELNERGILTDLGRVWTRATVHQILTNEKYIGNNVYNRRSFKLKHKRIANGPEMWIRSEGAFDAIVEPKQFRQVQAIIAARNRRISDEEMLERLTRLLRRHGYISGLVIDEADGMPTSGAYAHRFGSLLRAYSLIGFTPDRDYRYIEANRLLRQFHGDVVERVIREITRPGGVVIRNPATDLLTINNEFTASVVVARCRETTSGGLRWKIRFDVGLAPDITIAIRMNRTNTDALDYYLLPQFRMRRKHLGLAEQNGLMLDAFRFETLDFFFDVVRRVSVAEVTPW